MSAANPGHPEPAAAAGGPWTFMTIARALRPSQWTKNIVVFAALFFAFWDRSRPYELTVFDLALVGAAAAIFCLVSSGVYILNDIRDIPLDRCHPVKRHRAIASGRLPVPAAWTLALLLLGAGIGAAWLLPYGFAATVTGYVVLQLAYSFWLKRVAMVDILLISTGFVLRALAGGLVLRHVTISPWLLLCTFLLALFLALCKRRHEKILPGNNVAQHRPSLEHYDEQVLDQLISISAGATLVAYAIYTLSPQTVAKFGTAALGFTIPFVVFGLFRYLDLAYRHEKGDRPERILLTDIPLLVDLGLYAVSVVVILLLTP